MQCCAVRLMICFFFVSKEKILINLLFSINIIIFSSSIQNNVKMRVCFVSLKKNRSNEYCWFREFRTNILLQQVFCGSCWDDDKEKQKSLWSSHLWVWCKWQTDTISMNGLNWIEVEYGVFHCNKRKWNSPYGNWNYHLTWEDNFILVHFILPWPQNIVIMSNSECFLAFKNQLFHMLNAWMKAR